MKESCEFRAAYEGDTGEKVVCSPTTVVTEKRGKWATEGLTVLPRASLDAHGPRSPTQHHQRGQSPSYSHPKPWKQGIPTYSCLQPHTLGQGVLWTPPSPAQDPLRLGWGGHNVCGLLAWVWGGHGQPGEEVGDRGGSRGRPATGGCGHLRPGEAGQDPAPPRTGGGASRGGRAGTGAGAAETFRGSALWRPEPGRMRSPGLPLLLSASLPLLLLLLPPASRGSQEPPAAAAAAAEAAGPVNGSRVPAEPPPVAAGNHSGALLSPVPALLRDLSALKAAVIGACGLTAALIACLLLRVFRSGKRIKKTRKYDIITTPAERVEMAPLNEEDDEDEDSTVFDVKYR
uniref:Family with sequence similarity 174 member B n=1 Tax=Anser brachyrhynchus TaxID=132585 RepID=A0A8B9CZ03_9AVES